MCILYFHLWLNCIFEVVWLWSSVLVKLYLELNFSFHSFVTWIFKWSLTYKAERVGVSADRFNDLLCKNSHLITHLFLMLIYDLVGWRNLRLSGYYFFHFRRGLRIHFLSKAINSLVLCGLITLSPPTSRRLGLLSSLLNPLTAK